MMNRTAALMLFAGVAASCAVSGAAKVPMASAASRRVLRMTSGPEAVGRRQEGSSRFTNSPNSTRSGGWRQARAIDGKRLKTLASRVLGPHSVHPPESSVRIPRWTPFSDCSSSPPTHS